MQIVSDKLNEATARLDKYKWISEIKGEIAQAVLLQVKTHLGEALENSSIRDTIKEIVKEVTNSSKSSDTDRSVV